MADSNDSEKFEIPQELRDLLTEERLEMAGALVVPQNKGDLIGIASAAEEQIDEFLTRYRGTPRHAADPDAKLRKSPTFNDKISALKRVLPKVDPNAETIGSHIEFLESLRELRNKAAHDYKLTGEDTIALADNPALVRVTADFPDGAFRMLTSLRDYLTSLPL